MLRADGIELYLALVANTVAVTVLVVALVFAPGASLPVSLVVVGAFALTGGVAAAGPCTSLPTALMQMSTDVAQKDIAQLKEDAA